MGVSQRANPAATSARASGSISALATVTPVALMLLVGRPCELSR